jgi:hypothetical protein
MHGSFDVARGRPQSHSPQHAPVAGFFDREQPRGRGSGLFASFIPSLRSDRLVLWLLIPCVCVSCDLVSGHSHCRSEVKPAAGERLLSCRKRYRRNSCNKSQLFVVHTKASFLPCCPLRLSRGHSEQFLYFALDCVAGAKLEAAAEEGEGFGLPRKLEVRCNAKLFCWTRASVGSATTKLLQNSSQLITPSCDTHHTNVSTRPRQTDRTLST